MARLIPLLLLAGLGAALAQSPDTATQLHSDPVGFTYALPADWQIADVRRPSAEALAQMAQNAKTDEEKKGIACVQIVLNAWHGDPPSAVVIVALPFDCFGQTMSEKDLPGFASGASEGIKNTFDISNPEMGSYALGAHSMWIERASGALKARPESKYTIETVCTVLKKGAACFMTMAADEAGLETFEHGAVTLDGDPPAALAPASAFAKKP